MARQRAAIFMLGGLVLAVVGAGLFLALSQPGDLDEATDGEPNVADVDAPPTEEEETPGKPRRRAGKEGLASVVGLVELGAKEEPAVGQVVTLERDGMDTLSATTDSKGAFAFEKLAAGGPYEVSVVAEGLAPVRLPGIALDRRETRDVGTLVLDSAMRITVFVKRLDDTPVAGASVDAFASSAGQSIDWTKRMAQIGVAPVSVDHATTDEQGKVVFTDLAVGTWTLTASKEGLSRTGKSVTGKSGKTEVDPITIYLSRSFGVVGKVTDHKGNPFPEALVLGMAGSNAWNPTAAPLHARAVADENGEYELAALAPGDVAIWVARPGGVPSMFATVRIPDVERFDMVLVLGGKLEGTVTQEATGEPVVEATVRAQSWNGFSSRIAESVTDEEGHYAIDTLLEGNVNSITVEKDGFVQVREPGQQQWQQVPLNRDDTVVRDFKLRKAVVLSGTVSGPAGAIAGARVMIYTNAGLGGFQNKSTTTDGAGKYRFAGVDTGKSILIVSAPGHYQKGMPQQWWQALQQGTAPEEFSIDLDEKSGDVTKDIVLTAGTVVKGTVRSAEGTPIEGATVRGTGGSQTVTATTAADGSFRLEGVTPAPQATVYASAEGFGAASKQVAIAEDVEPEEIEFEMVRNGKVRGTVRAAGSAELVDAYVQIGPFSGGNQGQTWPPQSASARWTTVEKAPVLADGTYEINTLAAGKFVVRASALGFESTFSEPQDAVPGQEWYEVDIVLGEGSTLRGRVTDAETGAAIAGALVRLGSGAQQQMVYNGMNQMHRMHPVVAVTEQDGTYEVLHAARGNYTVSVQADGYVDKTQATAVPPKGDIDLKVQPELEIRGVVKMKDGTPVQGAQVAASKAGGNPQNFGGYNPSQSISGSDGSFRVAGLGKGEFSLLISPPWNSNVNIKPHTHGPVAAGTTDVEVTVESGLVIAGSVVDSDGKGIASVFLNAQPEGTGGGMWRNAQSDKDGTFRILGLKEGTFTIHVQTNWSGAGNFQAKQTKGVRAGTEDVRIELAAGFEIEGKVVDEQTKPVANLQITAQRIQEEGATQQQNFGGWANTSTDAEGKFTLKGLSPGKYRLNGQGNNGMMAPGRGGAGGGKVLLGGEGVAAGTNGVLLTYSEGATIEGTVTNEAGKPIQAATVNAMPKGQGMFNRSAASDENGRFVLTGLLPNVEYQMTASHDGHKQASVAGVRAGTTNVSIVLAAGVRVTGTLLTADGASAGQTPIMFTHQKEGGGTGQRTMATSKPDGTFDKGGLDEGTYKLQAWKLKETEGGARTGAWVDLGEIDAPAENVTLRMPRED